MIRLLDGVFTFVLYDCRNKRKWLHLGNEDKFEQWVNKAYKYKNNRAEPIYAATKYFREKSQHLKALHYHNIGKKIPYPKDDLLFVVRIINQNHHCLNCNHLNHM